METTNKQINQEEERNLNPLGKDEMNALIKSFQMSSFNSEQFYQNEKKMFVKKSLYELAIDSEKVDDKEINNEIPEKIDKETEEQKNENSLHQNETEILKEDKLAKENPENNRSDLEHLTNDDPIIEEENNKKTAQESRTDDQQDIEDTKQSFQNTSISENENIDNAKENISSDGNKIENQDIEKKQNFEEETLDAMDSVRKAVVKSLEKNEEKSIGQSLDINNDYQQLSELFENIKNATITEIEKNIKNKIYEVSSEIAGYQIDKAPEKFFQKIKKVLSELNNIKDEITIILNENDFNVLKKVDKNNLFSKNVKFQKNTDFNRGEFSISAGGLLHSVMYSSDNKF